MAEDKNVQDEIIVMVDEDGKEVEFNHIATLDYNDKWYIYIQPVELEEGMEDDEMFIMEIQSDENGDDLFVPVEDEELLDTLYEEYLKECELED